MGKSVHSCGSSNGRRQAYGNLGIKDRIPGDQREIVDGVFIPCLCIGDHGSQSGLTSGPGGGGDGDEKGQPFMYLQDPFHFCQRLAGLGDAGAYRFGAVHAGTAPEADDAVTIVVPV